ncbi:MAG: hypothetical protein M3380_04720, partial [Chloroflexota bacterium]|nr:hypothetical protein [Chloroflexota bacterium]
MPVANTCERCGTSNPPMYSFCRTCGAELDASPTPATISLPDWLRAEDGRPPEATPDETMEENGRRRVDDLPPWLGDPGLAETSPEGMSGGKLPPWLAAYSDAAADAGAGDAPASGLGASPRPVAANGVDQTNTLPAWLRDEQIDSSAAAPDALPSFLQGTNTGAQSAGAIAVRRPDPTLEQGRPTSPTIDVDEGPSGWGAAEQAPKTNSGTQYPNWLDADDP